MTFTEFKRLLNEGLINPHSVHLGDLHLEHKTWKHWEGGSDGIQTAMNILDVYYEGHLVCLTDDCAKRIVSADYGEFKWHIHAVVRGARRVRQRAEDEERRVVHESL